MEEKTQSPRTGRRTFADTYPQGLQLSQETVSLLERKNKKREALTFDEVTLEDKPSMFHPNEVNVRSFITRKISLKSCGILSAAMVLHLPPSPASVRPCVCAAPNSVASCCVVVQDTVTEQEMALAMAKNGGIGVLHRNLDAQAQAQMVKWIRKKINSDGMIDKPITFRPNDYYSYLQKVRHTHTHTSAGGACRATKDSQRLGLNAFPGSVGEALDVHQLPGGG